jgi:NAD(P)-dependent dehydrogenase (short-subunit alcohol dehydrogenase family)
LLIPEFDLKDKVVFITGAGRGIGRGITEVLAEAGADVAVNALTENHVVAMAKAVADRTGRKIVPVLGDVTSSEGADQAVAQVTQAWASSRSTETWSKN